MNRKLLVAAASLALITGCKMENPLLTESPLPYGAPQFDKIKNEHYLPAFETAIAQAKAEIDAIVANTQEPTFENTIEALEFSGRTLDRVSSIFFNVFSMPSTLSLLTPSVSVIPLPAKISLILPTPIEAKPLDFRTSSIVSPVGSSEKS